MAIGVQRQGCTGSFMADIQQKPHRKHLANCINPCIHLQILPFEAPHHPEKTSVKTSLV